MDGFGVVLMVDLFMVLEKGRSRKKRAAEMAEKLKT